MSKFILAMIASCCAVYAQETDCNPQYSEEQESEEVVLFEEEEYLQSDEVALDESVAYYTEDLDTLEEE